MLHRVSSNSFLEINRMYEEEEAGGGEEEEEEVAAAAVK
jgi:hypothetical protein